MCGNLSEMLDLLDMLAPAAPAIALVAAVVAAGVACALAVRSIRQALQTWRTWHAALDLVDVHVAALEHRADESFDRSSQLADTSEHLVDRVSGLAAGVRALHHLLASVGRERARMRRALLDLLLPTSDDGATTHDAGGGGIAT